MEMMLSKKDMEKMKLLQLELFKEFIRVCTILNLHYYCVGGTLLGAIRHSGFIPWDDDIDVAMPREDYDIFCAKAQPFLRENIFLQTEQSDPQYPFNFAKLRDKNTTFIETSVSDLKINHGIYIDIFPLDGLPSNRIKSDWERIKSKLLFWRISDVFLPPERDDRIKKLAKKIVVKLSLILTGLHSVQETVKVRGRQIKKYSFQNSNIITNYCGAWGKKEIFPKEWLGNGVCSEFEGLTVIVPERYDLYLEQLYGDYMKYPPLEKQVSHHYCKVIDLEKPYTDYV